ncbi:unnamed protein product [Chondrus crispus]|uniref:Uncharacterized protein n=1 Tax=Chondrus crispus TaxID=2769 RepID=R7QEB9_CHOCR|nr:unnamed protein product [Chondrus crispus]CDF35801.1 unnamed protein product [Chondrus crispus]|eukprot:XP_005715620.1 unnamed protein product [Chondrus crispus]
MHPPMHQPLAQQQQHHQNHHQPQHQRQPVMLGLTQVPSDVASRLGSVLTVSSADAPSVSTDDPRERKKRKRMAGAATTMACVMFMWGAFVGTPGLLKGSASYRSDGNLPAVWTSTPTDTAVARVMPNRRPHSAEPDHSWQPNCMRVLEQLPHGKEDLEPSTKDEPIIADPATDLDTQRQEPREDKDIDTEANKMFVDMADENAASVVARADDTEAVIPEYSYVLIRDAVAAMDSIKSCRHRLRHGNHCGQPHSISLILPASAAGLEEDVNDTQRGSIQLAEVQCTVMSVARIPSNAATVNKATPGNSNYGKVIATAGVRHAKSA